MPILICPVCGQPLRRENRSLLCPERHCFDIAKQGYVNLLRSNQSAKKRHGDDSLMVRARRDFLDKGYYRCLLDALCEMSVRHTEGLGYINFLDAGCGEGWYTAALHEALLQAGHGCDAVGLDISRDALICAAKRDRSVRLAAATLSDMPIADESCDLLVHIFAPDEPAEFRRVLKPGGILLHAMPLEAHLAELKAAVYDTPRPNPPAVYAPEGFTLLERRDVCRTVTITGNDDIRALFMMTPYYYKTGRADQQKLDALDRLDLTLAFGVFALRRD